MYDVLTVNRIIHEEELRHGLLLCIQAIQTKDFIGWSPGALEPPKKPVSLKLVWSTVGYGFT